MKTVTVASFAIFILISCTNLQAQSLEPFETHDYIDPKFRKSLLGDSLNFLDVSGSTGAVFNYQYNNTFTNEDFVFTRLAACYYLKDIQVNGKFIRFNPAENAEALTRGKFQFAYYAVQTSRSRSLMRRDTATGDTLESFESYRSNALRLQVTYNYIRRPEFTDHQMVFDYSLNIKSDERIRDRHFANYVYGNFFAGWMLNRHEFLYGVSAKGSYPINRVYILRSFGYGYNVLRSRINGTDRWGNFKVECFLEVGSRNISVFFTYSWTRELHLKFNNNEFSFFINLPLIRDVH